jgi:hypothetical protein
MALALALEARNHPFQKATAPNVDEGLTKQMWNKYFNQQARMAQQNTQGPWAERL